MLTRTTSALLTAALAGAALSGCANLVPPPPNANAPASTGGLSTRAKLAIARGTHEYPPSSVPRQTVIGAAPGAEQAIRAYATAYINWTATTVPRDMLLLAARSVGQARSAAALAAAQTAGDYELRRGGVANSGTVEAVAPLQGGSGRYVVVTLERTTATDTDAYDGLRPVWHLTIATVDQLAPGRWVVSGWQPES